jgi:crotonobetainyl-CoA:carnitine CoA-transferase CaiB-like acyl-CoA transferase
LPALSPAEGPVLALDDLRVIDLSQGIAGPYCAKLLADCGAEVIKVEPPGGDYARSLGPFPSDIPHHDKGGLFVHLNGNKKSVTLDIETESGRTVLRKLLARADVLVEGYPPGHLASMGLGYDDLKGELPDLIYCSVTPFGQTGPYSGFRGNSLTCMALSGLMYVTGDPDKEPLCTGGEPAEYFAGVTAWVAVLAAVEHRQRGGGGQHIDVSMLEALGAADEYNTALYSLMGAVRKRFYSHHLLAIYPMEIYPCRNGYIVVVGGATGFPLGMAVLLEQPELEQHPLFQNPWMRLIQWRQFEEILRPYLLEHDWQDLLARAQELRIPFAAVLDPRTLLENEHLKERDFFREVEQPEVGPVRMAGAPFRMSETRLRQGPAPTLGQHTHDVLLELGYDPEDARILRERGIT